MWGLGLSGGEQQILVTQSVLPLYPALESGVIIAISRMLFLTPKPSFLFPYSNHKLYHWRTRGPQRLLATPYFTAKCPCFALVAETSAEVQAETHAGKGHQKYTRSSSMRAFAQPSSEEKNG